MTEGCEPYRWWRYPSSRGASFAVKRSELDAALDAAPARGLHEVVLATHSFSDPGDFFWKVGVPRPSGVSSIGFCPLARATWTGADGSPVPLVAEVSFFSVPRDRRAELSALMQGLGLTRILEWIRQFETASETRRDATHRLAVYVDRGELTQTEHSGWPTG